MVTKFVCHYVFLGQPVAGMATVPRPSCILFGAWDAAAKRPTRRPTLGLVSRFAATISLGRLWRHRMWHVETLEVPVLSQDSPDGEHKTTDAL